MDPALETLEKALDKKLRKGEKAKDFLNSLSDAATLLVNLDIGMLDGAVLSKERRESLVPALMAFARKCFERAVALDPAASTRWISELPVYQRPKGIDFAEWEGYAREAKGAAPAARPIDLASIAEPLSGALRRLVRLWASDSARHTTRPPASDEQIREREAEFGFELPDDLRVLYRLSNGFALFRRRGSIDIDDAPFRLVPLHELQPAAWAAGDELPKKKRKVRGKSLNDAIDDPARLQVFDVGNGDFVSACVHDGKTIWLDDYSDGPQGALTDSLAELLDYVLSEKRIDPSTGSWTDGAWEGLSLRASE